MLYDYRCASCGKETEAINKIEHRHTHAPSCCGGPMTLFISQAPYGYVTMDIRYVCPVTRSGVTSLRQRKNIMAEHGLVDANDIVTDKAIAARQKRWDDQCALVEKHKGPPEIQEYVDRWAMAS